MKLSLYGKYAGKLETEKEYLQNCSEMELFIQVSTFYEPINSYQNISTIISSLEKQKKFYETTKEVELAKYIAREIKMLAKRIENLTERMDTFLSDEWNYPLDFCILQTARFGTKVTYNPNGRVMLTEEFKNWYNNWQAYITYMDDETLAYYRTCRYEEKGLDKFHLDKPIEKKPIIQDIESIKPYTYKLKNKSTEQRLA